MPKLNELQKLYKTLLKVYISQVEILEAKNINSSRSELARVLNRNFFLCDEVLKNYYYQGSCYEEKNIIMPHFIHFLATYEKCTEDQRQEFERLKLKDNYQIFLNGLYLDKTPFLEFLEKELENLKFQESICGMPPVKPIRSNATRQLEQYRIDKENYDKEIDEIDSRRREITDRIKEFEKILND